MAVTDRNSDINSLSKRFRERFDKFWKEVINKYPNAVVFETLRTPDRQKWLYAQWRTRPWKIVTWTLKSNHFTWDAVDIVFRNTKTGNLEWVWPYMDIIEIAKKYWIRNLYPAETAHFEFDTNVVTKTFDKDSVLKDLWVIWGKLDWYPILQGDAHNLANKIRAL